MTKRPEVLVEQIYMLADLLTDAERLLDGTFGHNGLLRDLPQERADQLERLLGGCDLFMTSRAIRKYADAWQGQLDTELQAPEAESLRDARSYGDARISGGDATSKRAE